MSSHGANPILLKKKQRLNVQNTRLTPHPVGPITSHFCLIQATPPPPQSGHHMCITL